MPVGAPKYNTVSVEALNDTSQHNPVHMYCLMGYNIARACSQNKRYTKRTTPTTETGGEGEEEIIRHLQGRTGMRHSQ